MHSNFWSECLLSGDASPHIAVTHTHIEPNDVAKTLSSTNVLFWSYWQKVVVTVERLQRYRNGLCMQASSMSSLESTSGLLAKPTSRSARPLD